MPNVALAVGGLRVHTVCYCGRSRGLGEKRRLRLLLWALHSYDPARRKYEHVVSAQQKRVRGAVANCSRLNQVRAVRMPSDAQSVRRHVTGEAT
eukprot:7320473-Prymnesium_polylepis.4